MMRWGFFQLVVPLMPFVVGILLAMVRSPNLSTIQWGRIFTTPEILFLGVVVSAVGLRDFQDVADTYPFTGFHEFLQGLLFVLLIMAMALYGDLHGSRLCSDQLYLQNPNHILPVSLSGLMIILAGIGRLTLLRLQHNQRTSER
jgi:hypothetical protein